MPGEGSDELLADDVDRRARLALGKLLADAEDGPEAGLDGPAELAADQSVGLTGIATTLGVAEDDPA